MALSRRAFGGVAIGGSAAALAAACGDGGGSGDSGGSNELTWAVASSWEGWNLNTTSGNSSYGKQALTPMIVLGGEGVDFNPDGEAFNDDAVFDAPTELVSEEPMQLRLRLKEGAVWSDGEPVRLEDFLFQWYSLSGDPQHANQEKATPASTAGYESISSIEQDEDGSILITFVDGYLDPEWQFFGGIYLPSHVADAEGFDWQNDPEAMGDAIQFFNTELNPVGVGPYVPVDWELGEFVTYEPNERYQGSVKPGLEKLTIKYVEDLSSIVTELRQGTIDGSWPSNPLFEELAPLDEDPDLTYEGFAGSVWSHIDINLNNKFLSDAALRQAVFTVIDIADITAKIFPGAEVPRKGNYYFSEGSPYYVDYLGETTQGSGDLEAARQILTDAGYTWDGEEKLLTPDGERVAFNFRYVGSDSIRTTTAELVQSYAAQIGIDVELRTMQDDELSSTLEGRDFDMVIFSWSGNPAFTGSVRQYLHSESESNYIGLDDPDLDANVDAVTQTVDLDEAAEYANRVCEAGIAHAVLLPLYDSPQAVCWNSSRVDGIVNNGNSQAGPLWNVREWKAA